MAIVDEQSRSAVSWRYRLKYLEAAAILHGLGAGFEAVSRGVPAFARLIESWPEGGTVSFGVLPDGPQIVLVKERDRLRFLGFSKTRAGLEVLFKHLDVGLLPLRSEIGADTAFAQHRAILRGDVNRGRQVAQALGLVQRHLMPDFLLKRVLKRVPPRPPLGRILRVYGLVTWLVVARLGSHVGAMEEEG